MAKDKLPKIDAEGNLEKTKFATKTVDGDIVTSTLGNGKAFSFDLSSYTDEVIHGLALHGLGQKIVDSYAGAKGDFAYAEDKLTTLSTQLTNGELRAVRAPGEAKPKSTELIQAVANLQNLSIVDAGAAVDALDEDQLKAVRAHSAIKAEIARIRAEKALAAAKGATFSLG